MHKIKTKATKCLRDSEREWVNRLGEIFSHGFSFCSHRMQYSAFLFHGSVVVFISNLFFFFFGVGDVYVSFWPTTAKTTVNRGYKTHSFKQAIHLVVVKQSHSFSFVSFSLSRMCAIVVLLFYCPSADMFFFLSSGYSYALAFAFANSPFILCRVSVVVYTI